MSQGEDSDHDEGEELLRPMSVDSESFTSESTSSFEDANSANWKRTSTSPGIRTALSLLSVTVMVVGLVVIVVGDVKVLSVKKQAEPQLFQSGVKAYDDAFHLALSEVAANTVNGSFIAGSGWSQLWTRDTSYAVELAASLVNPRASKWSLQECTEQVPTVGNPWLQDECGHFQGWPNLSDAIVGAQGAWALYLSTGDRDFLSWAYSVTQMSLVRAERDVFDGALFMGCSSFMESNSGYPASYRMNGTKVGKTKALSTNVLHYNGYKYAAMMGQELGRPHGEVDAFNAKAASLKTAIRSRFWLADKGYYAYFEDADKNLVTQMEGLGEALLLLAPDLETNTTRIDSIFANTYRTNVGLPCLWPRFDLKEVADIASYYHNGRVWPFVQGYWAMAAARHGKVDVFHEEFEHLVNLSQQQNTFAEFYELNGTFPEERRRQLWSSTGFLSMVYYGLFGLELQPRGIKFHPVKPSQGGFANTISLTNLPYRKGTLTIHVSGSGSVVESFKLNGMEKQKAFVSSNIVGAHVVEIALKETLDLS